MQEMPARLKGDAAGQIDTPADGRWNEAVREAYADRVQARLERSCPDWPSASSAAAPTRRPTWRR